MKSKQAMPSVVVPRLLGRSEPYLVAHEHAEQLELFRETLTRPAKLQVIAMMALSDPKHLDKTQYAKIADIAAAMGYERDTRKTDGKSAFPTWLYQSIEETGLNLRSKPLWVCLRKPAGRRKDGRRKYQIDLVELSILQDFGFRYEDEEGQPIDLDEIPKAELIRIEAVQGPALYALPMTDDQGNVIKNKDGSIRRKAANGVRWTFSSLIVKQTVNPLTAWVFYTDALPVLQKYLVKPASFDLIYLTLFWRNHDFIEMGHETLVKHLGIASKDSRRVEAAIDAAFADALEAGIIDKPVVVRDRGYYQPTPKTKRPRRIGKVYQWKRSARWQPGRYLPAPHGATPELPTEGKPESPKS